MKIDTTRSTSKTPYYECGCVGATQTCALHENAEALLEAAEGISLAYLERNGEYTAHLKLLQAIANATQKEF